jgi:uncharacterized Zn finger protein (UPF0148 family)
MARLYELNYGEKVTPDAFRMAMKRLGISVRALKAQSKEKSPRFCSCGKDLSALPGDIRKCPYCGIDIVALKCPKCKRSLAAFPTNIIYCPYCGTIVSKVVNERLAALPFARGRHACYSDEEDKKILELHAEGKSNKEIAKLHSRTTKAIRNRIRFLKKKLSTAT